MNYVYKNKTILEYLKDIGIESDKERMNITREIILLSMKKNISFEEAVDLYLQNFENNKKENKKIKKSSKEDKGIFYKGIKLREYLKKNYSDDLKNKKDINACYNSIRKYLNKCHENISVDEKIDYYFKNQYDYYIYIHKYNNLSYKGIDLFEIIKSILNIDDNKKINKMKMLVYSNYINIKKINNNLTDEKAIYLSLIYCFSKREIDELDFSSKMK